MSRPTSPENKFFELGEKDPKIIKEVPKPILKKPQLNEVKGLKKGGEKESNEETWPKNDKEIKSEDLPPKLEEELAKVRENIKKE